MLVIQQGGQTGSNEDKSGFYEKWNNINTIFNPQITLNGDFDLDELWGLNFNIGATSNSVEYDRNGVRSTGQNVYEFSDILTSTNKKKLKLIQKGM